MLGDPNLLIGVLALQSELIDSDQFAELCTLWSTDKSASLAALLRTKGWIDGEDLKHLEYLATRSTRTQESAKANDGTNRAKVAERKDREPPTAAGDQSTRPYLPATNDGVGCLLSDRFHLEHLHAVGGLGEIWIARDLHLNRDVAIKRLRAANAASDRDRKRFLREAQITGRLDHPGIVPVYALCIGVDVAQPYYAMRYVKGQALTTAIRCLHEKRQTGNADLRDFLVMLNHFVAVCNTVAYAHSKHIVHRDIKCDNVLLGNFGEVVVVDWGLAKALPAVKTEDKTVIATPDALTWAEVNATIADGVMGTPGYMSPEQAEGRADLISYSSDVYSLSAVLYEILAGRPPFQGATTIEILEKVCREDPLAPSQLQPDIPIDLEQICLKGLSKNPADRHRSAASLGESIEDWIADLAERTRSQQEREHFFSLSQNLLAVTDEDGKVQQTSPAWHQTLGLAPEHLLSRSFPQLIHADDRTTAAAKLREVVQYGKAVSFDGRVVTFDGTTRWVLWNATWIGLERLVYLVGRDVTELKRSEQRLQGLLESAPDAFVIVDRGGRIVMINSQAEALFGYSRRELEGQLVEILVPDSVRASHPQMREDYCRAPASRPMRSGLKLTGRRRDGREIPIEVALSPVVTDEGLLVFSAIRDMSGRA